MLLDLHALGYLGCLIPEPSGGFKAPKPWTEAFSTVDPASTLIPEPLLLEDAACG